MAFRKKQRLLEAYEPDLVLIQECEHTDKIVAPDIHDSCWFGDNVHKGVGVFSLNPEISLTPIPFEHENNRWFIPIKTNSDFSFALVWAGNHRKNQVIDKIQPSYRTLSEHAATFKGLDMIMGDFNNNVIWDTNEKRKYKKGTFQEILDLIASLGFYSVYHSIFSEAPGQESRPTHIWRKSYETTYHIDYCFLKENLQQNLLGFKLLDDEFWVQHSDHFPLLIDLDM
ncbi:MAG: hypothetical protein AAF696_37490 [Bacteroidota bacterium]